MITRDDRRVGSIRLLGSGIQWRPSSSTLQPNACPRLVAPDIYAELVKEYRLVRSKTSARGRHDVSRTGKARFTMANAAAALAPLGVKPMVNKIEVVTTVVSLRVTIACGLPGLDDCDGLRTAVPHLRKGFREVYGGVRVVSDPEQQDPPIQFVDTADRTVQAVWHVQRMIRRDTGRFRADRRKSVRAIATQRIRHPPERVGQHAHPEAGRRSRIEGMAVVIGHAGHHQSTVRPKDGLKRID
jgi:hypothetical protein